MRHVCVCANSYHLWSDHAIVYGLRVDLESIVEVNSQDLFTPRGETDVKLFNVIQI